MPNPGVMIALALAGLLFSYAIGYYRGLRDGFKLELNRPHRPRPAPEITMNPPEIRIEAPGPQLRAETATLQASNQQLAADIQAQVEAISETLSRVGSRISSGVDPVAQRANGNFWSVTETTTTINRPSPRVASSAEPQRPTQLEPPQTDSASRWSKL